MLITECMNGIEACAVETYFVGGGKGRSLAIECQRESRRETTTRFKGTPLAKYRTR